MADRNGGSQYSLKMKVVKVLLDMLMCKLILKISTIMHQSSHRESILATLPKMEQLVIIDF